MQTVFSNIRSTKLLAFLLNWNVITGVIDSLSNLPGLSFLSFFSSITIYFSLLFILLSILFTVETIDNWKSYFILLLWVILFALSLYINRALSLIATRAFIYFANNVLCIAILVQSNSDMNLLVESLKKYIPITIVYALLQWVAGIKNDESYSMAFSYGTMITMLLCMVLCTKKIKKRFIYIASFAVLLITNLRFGSRGSLLCCILIFVFYLFFTTNRKKIRMLTIIFCLVIVVVSAWPFIVMKLQQLFPSSRTILMLTNGQLLYGSGRDEIYGRLIQEFVKNPFAIRGLYSDRLFISRSLDDINLIWGCYAHNFFIELLFQWGIWCIPPILLLIMHMIRLFRKIKKAGEGPKVVLLITYAFSVGQLLISSSYLISPSFGLLIGTIIWSKRFETYGLLKLKDFN